MLAERESGLEALLQRVEPERVQPPGLGGRPRRLRQTQQRRPAPEVERVGDRVRGATRIAGAERAARSREQLLELHGVRRPLLRARTRRRRAESCPAPAPGAAGSHGAARRFEAHSEDRCPTAPRPACPWRRHDPIARPGMPRVPAAWRPARPPASRPRPPRTAPGAEPRAFPYGLPSALASSLARRAARCEAALRGARQCRLRCGRPRLWRGEAGLRCRRQRRATGWQLHGSAGTHRYRHDAGNRIRTELGRCCRSPTGCPHAASRW